VVAEVKAGRTRSKLNHSSDFSWDTATCLFDTINGVANIRVLEKKKWPNAETAGYVGEKKSKAKFQTCASAAMGKVEQLHTDGILYVAAILSQSKREEESESNCSGGESGDRWLVTRSIQSCCRHHLAVCTTRVRSMSGERISWRCPGGRGGG
jgi:hypothetical protein